MHSVGFYDALTTPAGADGGVDISSALGVAQVKYTTSPVGSPAVLQIAGASRDRRSLFYILSGYTKAAVRAGEEYEVALLSYSADGAVGAWTTKAVELLDFGVSDLSGTPNSVALARFVEEINSYGQAVANVAPATSQAVTAAVSSWREGTCSPPPQHEREALSRYLHEFERLADELNSGTKDKIAALVLRVQRLEMLQVRIARIVGVDYAELEATTLLGRQQRES